jgi:hypothetical protein
MTSLALYRVEPSGFRLVLEAHFDPISCVPDSFRSASKVTCEKISFRSMELHFSMIASHSFLCGLNFAALGDGNGVNLVMDLEAVIVRT